MLRRELPGETILLERPAILSAGIGQRGREGQREAAAGAATVPAILRLRCAAGPMSRQRQAGQLPGVTAELWDAFARRANWSGLHSLDWERFYKFVVWTHRHCP